MSRLRGWVAQWLRSVRTGRIDLPRQDRFFRPWLEILEDRLAPASFLVTNLSDDPNLVGSLRHAVDAANALGGANTITIAPSIGGQTISLARNDTLNPFAFGPTALVIGTPTKADNL